MNNDGTFQRLLESFDYILLGIDLFISILATVVFSIYIRDASGFNASILIQTGTSLATTAVAVILTGISILVTMSDKRALVALRKSNEYKRFLFTFEFTALLALSTAVLGILLQSFNYDQAFLILYVFLLSYSITAIATVVSRLITYGEKVATIAALEDLPEDLSEIVRHEEDAGSEENEETGEDETQSERRAEAAAEGNSET